MSERLSLPAAAALTLLTLGLWVYLLLFQGAGVQVANRSGAVIAGLTVCQGNGECLHRERLWPHQIWRVPLARAPGDQVKLTVQEMDGQAQSLTHTPGTTEKRAAFVVGHGGQIEIQ
ncbi:hypothetical protein [Deinococcus arenicola]|uniref:Uncharacterized protein n=1 Tax=Deinococcus arenicola TaxID=2994950 RepID=A0ABU4DU28_9DEIO|nr:hypothetical protein [Deinococcus sp. ZS9-10]MDV6375927.1 hypothetical protein [Deinococcus sp. ZS9-10]